MASQPSSNTDPTSTKLHDPKLEGLPSPTTFDQSWLDVSQAFKTALAETARLSGDKPLAAEVEAVPATQWVPPELFARLDEPYRDKVLSRTSQILAYRRNRELNAPYYHWLQPYLRGVASFFRLFTRQRPFS